MHCVYCVADGGPGWGLPPAKGRGRGTCYTTDNSKPLSADSPWKASSKQQHQLQPRNIASHIWLFLVQSSRAVCTWDCLIWGAAPPHTCIVQIDGVGAFLLVGPRAEMQRG